MAKCLRCGAGSEWLEGTVKPEADLCVTAGRTIGLFSASGKTQYFCPKCDSPHVLGPIIIMGSKSIVCQPCSSWYQWSSRIKRSVWKLGSIEKPRTSANREGAERG